MGAHTTALTFDLANRIRKNSQKTEKKPFRGGGNKRGRTLQESNRGGSLSRMDGTIDVM